MDSLMSAIGGASMTVGVLSAVRFLLTLTTRPAWPQLRVFARATPATTPATRRSAMIWFAAPWFSPSTEPSSFSTCRTR